MRHRVSARRLRAQARFGHDTLMQSGRVNNALSRMVDDPRRDDLSAALVASEHLEIGAGQLERGGRS